MITISANVNDLSWQRKKLVYAVKFQLFKAEKLVPKNSKQYNFLKT